MASRTLHIAKDGDKSFTGYLSIPPSGTGSGIVLVPEVYGVNADIRGIADRLAAAGYVVVAPDLFWRKEAKLEFAYADRAQAGSLLGELGGFEALVPDIAPTLDALRQAPEFDGSRVGIVGIGFGGILAYLNAARKLVEVDAGVAYFPGRLDLSIATEIAQPWLFHFGEHDSVVQPRNIDDLTREAFASNTDVAVHTYEGVLHGFAVPGRIEFDAVAAREAIVRTLDFLSRNVGWRAALAA